MEHFLETTIIVENVATATVAQSAATADSNKMTERWRIMGTANGINFIAREQLGRADNYGLGANLDKDAGGAYLDIGTHIGSTLIRYVRTQVLAAGRSRSRVRLSHNDFNNRIIGICSRTVLFPMREWFC